MVHLETIGEISNTGPPWVLVGDYDDLVATVNQFGGQLINVALDSSWLREEEVANHSDVICTTHDVEVAGDDAVLS